MKDDLPTITAEIHAALKSETANIVTLGNLLAKAKAQISHGEWLPWLKTNFSMSEASAQNYLRVHRFLKSRTVRDLEAVDNLSASALYMLSAKTNLVPNVAIKQVFEEAQTKRVGGARVRAISAIHFHPYDARKTTATVTPLVPPAPPPEPPTRAMAQLGAFDQAIAKLKELATKPATQFSGSAHNANDIQIVADFLLYVARLKGKAAA
jgi:hypothetical protein